MEQRAKAKISCQISNSNGQIKSKKQLSLAKPRRAQRTKYLSQSPQGTQRNLCSKRAQEESASIPSPSIFLPSTSLRVFDRAMSPSTMLRTLRLSKGTPSNGELTLAAPPSSRHVLMHSANFDGCFEQRLCLPDYLTPILALLTQCPS